MYLLPTIPLGCDHLIVCPSQHNPAMSGDLRTVLLSLEGGFSIKDGTNIRRVVDRESVLDTSIQETNSRCDFWEHWQQATGQGCLVIPNPDGHGTVGGTPGSLPGKGNRQVINAVSTIGDCLFTMTVDPRASTFAKVSL